MLKKLLFVVVTLAIVLGSFASALIVPVQDPYRVEAEEPESGVIVANQNTEIEYTGNSSIDEETGQTVYEYQAHISSLPLYMPDLETRIDPSFHWDSEAGVWYSGVNLFDLTINGSQVTAFKDGEEIQWDPTVYIGGQVVQAPDKAMLITIDPIDENYNNNILEWDYGVCVRQLRLIEGILIENYIFNEDPGADVRIDSNSYKTPNFVWMRAPYAYDAGYRPLEIMVDDTGKTVNASEFANATYPVVVDDSLGFDTSTDDCTIMYSRDPSYSTAWSSTSGAIFNGAYVSWIGQNYTSDNQYEVFRSFLYFNTASIPDDATIYLAELSLWGFSDHSATDFNIVIQSGMPTYPRRPAVESDYNKNNYSGNGGSIGTSGFSAGGWNFLLPSSAGLAWISKTGWTKFCLRSSRDISGYAPSGEEYVMVRDCEFGQTYCPQLDVYFDRPCSNPTTPSSPSPSNGASVISVDTDLSWYSNADSYAVYFSTNPDPSSSYYGTAYGTSYYSLPTLSEYTNYHWRILAQNNCGTSIWGPIWEFTTGGAPCTTPSTPSLSIPSSGAIGISIYPYLDWTDSSNVNYYNIYLGTSSNPALYTTTYSSEYYPSLSYSTRYYWKIEAVNNCGSVMSLTRSFTTESAPPCDTPGTPVNPNPSNGAISIPISTALDWSDCASADYYYVYFGTSSNPSYIGTSYSSYYNSLPTLSYGTLYYWRVVAVNDCGSTSSSVSSSTWRFTTVSAPPPPSTPATPEGLSVAEPGQNLTYTVSRIPEDNGNNNIEYRFDFGDGMSQWSSTSTTASHWWPVLGTYQVKAQARSSTGTSQWSPIKTVTLKPDVFNVAIVPVNLQGSSVTIPLDEFNSVCDRLKSYFNEVSYGSLAMNPQVYYNLSNGEWFSLGNTAEYYHENYQLFDDAVSVSDETVDFTRYDDGSDNGYGAVVFVTRNGSLFPMPAFYGGVYTVPGSNIRYARIWIPQPQACNPYNNTCGLSIFTHEIGHALGLTDLYNHGMASAFWYWDPMVSSPADRVHFSSVSKEDYGWLSYSEIASGSSYSLPVLTEMSYGSNVPRYTYTSSTGKTCHYIIELRSNQTTEWDSDFKGWINHVLYGTAAVGIYAVEASPHKIGFWMTLADNRILLSPGSTFSDPDAGVTFRLNTINSHTATFSVENFQGNTLAGAVMAPDGNVFSAVYENLFGVESYSGTTNMTLPDIDLHAYTPDGKHIGMNYSTGEYEVQIPGALVSEDSFNGREWIFVPDNIKVRFSVDTRDIDKFLEENPEALAYTDGIESYNISTHYFDASGNKSDSPWVNDRIPAGVSLAYTANITQNPDGTYDVEVVRLEPPAWSAMTSGTTVQLNSVWGSNSSNVFAVGASGNIRYYNGNAWSKMTSGITSLFPPSLNSVWGSNSSNVFAVGASGNIRYYNGNAWSKMTSGITSLFPPSLNGVWGSSSSNVFAVGASGTILYYNGNAWSKMKNGITSLFPPSLNGVWGSSSSNVFAVGASGTIRYYNGTSWTGMTSGTTKNLNSVWGTGANDVFAVGDSGTVLHYNGSAWSTMNSTITTALYDIWGSSFDNVFAIGASGKIIQYK